MEYKSEEEIDNKIKNLKRDMKFNKQRAKNTWRTKKHDIGQIIKYGVDLLLTVAALGTAMFLIFTQIPILWFQIVLGASLGVMSVISLFGNGYAFGNAIADYRSEKKDKALSKSELKERTLQAEKENKVIKEQIEELKQQKQSFKAVENVDAISVESSQPILEENKILEKADEKVETKVEEDKKFSKLKTLHMDSQNEKTGKQDSSIEQ